MSKNDDKTSKTKTAVKKNPLQGLNINKLSNLRIIQKHLVYVIGLSGTLANKEVIFLYNKCFRFWANTNTSVSTAQY